MLITRTFSLTNFIIASSALAFQVGILYPWHHELDREFQELRKEYRMFLDEERNERAGRLEELKTIRRDIEALRSSKSWFGK
jgi:hypothetical protein